MSRLEFNIHEAKTHLSKLVERALAGDEVIIAKAGSPVAKLVPYSPSDRPRRPGGWRDRVWIAPDFEDLPQDLIESFQGD